MKEKTESNNTAKGLVNTLTIAFLMLSITIGTITLVTKYQQKKKGCSCKKENK